MKILCRTKKFKGNAAVTFIAVLVLGLLSVPGLTAQENDCDALMKSLSQGEIPAIIINSADETVKFVTSRGACSESIEAWSNRDAQPSGGGKPAKSIPSAGTKAESRAVTGTPKPTSTEPESFKKLTPGQTFTPAPDTGPAQKIQSPRPPATAPSPVVKPSSPQASCDYRLGEIWETQIFKIEDVEHWLARAFTLDLNGDLEVDNISFTFVAKDGSERIFHYFAASGEISGQMYPALSLLDESLIHRLCFGDLNYKKPKFFGDKKLGPTLIEVEKPDLSGEMKAKQKGVPYKSKSKKKTKPVKNEESTPWWVWVAAGGGGLVVVGAAIFILRRRKKAKKTSKEEDGEEDDEESSADEDDEEEGDGSKSKKKKKGLGALFSRFKKKPKKAKDKDEGKDEEEPAAKDESAAKEESADKG